MTFQHLLRPRGPPIIAITVVVQLKECRLFGASVARPASDAKPASEASMRRTIFPVAAVVKRKSNKADEVKFFEGISESLQNTTIAPTESTRKRKINVDVNLGEIKVLLSKLLEKIQDIEKEKREIKPSHVKAVDSDTTEDSKPVTSTTPKAPKEKKKRKNHNRANKQRWGKWTNWSPCSVSCGKGREIRWRHCLENCEVAETEMEEKTCQLPACGPSKLFGVIKI